MRTMEIFKLLKPLIKKTHFSSADAKKLGVNSALLGYYVKTGLLERIRRGVYRGTEAPTSNSIQWGDLIDAIQTIPGGTVCLISALSIYGLTEEIPRQHWIAVKHETSIKAPRPIKIIRYRNMSLGRTEITIDGARIPIFDRERTIVDAFRQLSREAAIKALKMAFSPRANEKIDLIKLENYAKQLRVPIEPYLQMVTT